MAIVRAHEILGGSHKAAVSVNQEEIQELVKDLKSELRTGKFQVAQALLNKIITELPGIKKEANVFINTIVSVREGLSSSEITKKEATSELKEGLTRFETALTAMLEEVDQSEAPEAMEDLKHELSDELKAYEADTNSMQVKINNNGFFVGYAPVLPLVQPAFNSEALKKNGFTSARFGGYLILHKQLVAGFSNDYVKSHLSEKEKAKGGRAAEEKILQDLVDTVTAKYKRLKLVPVAPPSGWYGATWFWLIPERDLALLRKCTMTGPNSSTFKVSKWSFPFYRSAGK